jgi:FKBP-type peptidyl-prolyl cis-trans isomerase FkpA
VTHRFLLCGLLALAACKGAANSGAPASTGPLRNDEEKTLYALGLHEGQRLGAFNLTPAEVAIVERGMRDQLSGARPQVPLREWGPRINDLAQTRSRQRGEQEKTRGRAFADRAAQESGAVRTPSGLVFKETRAGTGPQPTAEDTVRVHYRGTLIDGTEFDTTRGRDPAEFPLRGVVPCWTEGMQRMHVGGTARLVCPVGHRVRRPRPARHPPRRDAQLRSRAPRHRAAPRRGAEPDGPARPPRRAARRRQPPARRPPANPSAPPAGAARR